MCCGEQANEALECLYGLRDEKGLGWLVGFVRDVNGAATELKTQMKCQWKLLNSKRLCSCLGLVC